MNDLDEKLRAAAMALLGHATFRAGQREAITANLTNRDVLLVMPTGGGKSLCYQIPAWLRSRNNQGPVLVISPLIALMEDQAAAAREKGLRAETVHSAMSWDDQKGALDRAHQAEILFVSPERVAVKRFVKRLQKLAVSTIAVDEAHCVAEWGHDFRPEYLRLGELRETLNVPVIAVTATATPQVQSEIIESLRMREPERLSYGVIRPNLSLSVEHHTGDIRRQQRVAQLLAERSFAKRDGPGRALVYASSRKRVVTVAKFLRAQGLCVAHYHAGRTEGVRARAAQQFRTGDVKIMVATTAFGMGIDLPDIRIVMHVQAPPTLESWYQQVGRAGRDGLPSEAVLLWSLGDKRLRDRIVGEDPSAGARRGWEALERLVDGAVCRESELVRYFDEDAAHICGRCDVCGDRAAVERMLAQTTARRSQLLDEAISRRRRDDAVSLSEGQREQVVSFVDAMHRPLSKRVVAAGLRGSKAKQFRRGKFADNPHSGALRGVPAAAIVRAIEVLLTEGRLARKGKKYPTVWMPEKRVRPKTTRTPREASANKDPLERALKSYRRAEARRRGWKSYQVFNNRTLRELVTTRPDSTQGLQEVYGMGPTRLRRYGEEILRLIRQTDPPPP